MRSLRGRYSLAILKQEQESSQSKEVSQTGEKPKKNQTRCDPMPSIGLMETLTRLLILSSTLIQLTSTAVPKTSELAAKIGPVCMDSRLWSLPTFDAGDCSKALQNLLNGDVATWGREVIDFLVAGATSRTQYSKVQLPLAYDYGTCTLAIAMLATVPVRYVPPIPPGTFFAETDRSTFEILSLAAQTVKQKCVDNGGDKGQSGDDNFRVTLPGWTTVGSRNAIGVFFFDSRSSMRRLVNGDYLVHGTNDTSNL